MKEILSVFSFILFLSFFGSKWFYLNQIFFKLCSFFPFSPFLLDPFFPSLSFSFLLILFFSFYSFLLFRSFLLLFDSFLFSCFFSLFFFFSLLSLFSQEFHLLFTSQKFKMVLFESNKPFLNFLIENLTLDYSILENDVIVTKGFLTKMEAEPENPGNKKGRKQR